MKRKSEIRTRSEISEKIENNSNDLEEKEDDLDRVATDIETIRNTVEELDFGGTEEGAKELETGMKETEDVTSDVFDEEDEALEEIQEDNQEFGYELQDSRDLEEGDLGKVVDASAKTETNETVNEYLKVKETVLGDIDFMHEQIQRGSEAREKSDAVQDEHRARVNSRKGR